MRKTIFIFIVILFVNSSAADRLVAQVGIKIGMSHSILSISENEARPFLGYEIEWLTWQKLTGLQLGVSTDFEISKHFGMQAEIFYARRGMDASTQFLFDEIDYKIQLDYIEMPAEFKLKLPLTESIATGLVVGPYFAINIGAKRQSQIDGISERIKLGNVSRFDYGLIAGLYSDFVVGNLKLVLDLRYNHGLANVMQAVENSVSISGEDGTVRNKSLNILLGVRL